MLIGPIAEEIFFRGILYGFFRRWGAPTAIVLSTLLFVLPHTSGSIIPVTQLIGGILFAVAYEVEKNLLVPMLIHCLGNLAIFNSRPPHLKVVSIHIIHSQLFSKKISGERHLGAIS